MNLFLLKDYPFTIFRTFIIFDEHSIISLLRQKSHKMRLPKMIIFVKSLDFRIGYVQFYRILKSIFNFFSSK